jgi:hypothetical protein
MTVCEKNPATIVEQETIEPLKSNVGAGGGTARKKNECQLAYSFRADVELVLIHRHRLPGCGV